MKREDIIRMALAGKQPLKDRIEYAIALEREACAALCDDLDDDLPDGLAGWQYGEAIRARGLENLNKAAEMNGEEL